MLNPKVKDTKVKRPDVLLAIQEEEERTDRTNFSDKVKAEIYARDRAICAFTGMNLWLLDEGAGGFYNMCCIDHIIPASKNGTSTADNGLATFVAYNYNKGNNIGANLYLFANGLPTFRFWEYHRRLTPEMAQMIVHNSLLQPSDYYFNQAISNFICGVWWLSDENNTKYKRDDDYYAEATLRKLDTWRRAIAIENSDSLELRGLVPDPLTSDQKLLLSLREAKTTTKIKKLMKEVIPYHSANLEARLKFEDACEIWVAGGRYDEAFSSLEEMLTNLFVSDVVAGQIWHNVYMIIDPFAPWDNPEAMEKYNEETESGEVN